LLYSQYTFKYHTKYSIPYYARYFLNTHIANSFWSVNYGFSLNRYLKKIFFYPFSEFFIREAHFR